jgi:hypothetical protein
VEHKTVNHRRRVWRDPYEYGRIRLYNQTSWMLRDLLNRERLRLYIERKEAAKTGTSLTTWNQDIAKITQILGEVNRLRREKGWNTATEQDDGEPEYGNTERTSPELSPGT